MSCTVDKYLLVLTSKLTQYDVAESRRELKRGRGTNIYRLGLLLEAAGKVREDMKDTLDRGDAEALDRLKRSLGKRFTGGFPPVKNVLKQIDQGRCSIAKR